MRLAKKPPRRAPGAPLALALGRRASVSNERLANYRAKRDFSKTAEPSGEGEACLFESIALHNSEARGIAFTL